MDGSLRLPVKANETLRVGDVVCIGQDGRLRKSDGIVLDRTFVVPASATIKDGVMTIPIDDYDRAKSGFLPGGYVKETRLRDTQIPAILSKAK
jgi:hypothetical protein